MIQDGPGPASRRSLACALLAWLGLCAASCDRKTAPATNAPDKVPPRITLAVPEEGAYTGAYIDFGEPYDATNTMALYYPGSDYVDWLGLSVYGTLFPEGGWDGFEDMIDKPYAELAAVDETKPMMLAEWGVGEFPAKGSKAEWIEDGFNTIRESFPRLHAAVYWHERWQNSNTFLYSNLRLNSSPDALEAYRNCVSLPFWLDRPIYR